MAASRKKPAAPRRHRISDGDVPMVSRAVLRGLEKLRVVTKARKKLSRDITVALEWIEQLSDLQRNPEPACEGPV